jgi:hypothetical protein
MALNRAAICERWDMPLAEQNGSSRWFVDWVRRDARQASAHVTAGYCAYRALSLAYAPGELRTAEEFFGGLGCQSLIIGDLWQPERHTVHEQHPAAVEHLRALLPRADVRHSDSYTVEPGGADLVGLDFGDLTAWRLREGQPHRLLLDAVFARKPKAVVLTDIAGPRLHLHRERYGAVLGAASLPGYRTYLEALVRWFQTTYDYALVRGYWQKWSTVLALVPAENFIGLGSLEPVPDRPRGIEIV